MRACVPRAQAYAAQYSGQTRVARLLFIADRGGPALELDALRLAADTLKKGVDTKTYVQARRGLQRSTVSCFLSMTCAPTPAGHGAHRRPPGARLRAGQGLG